MMILGDERRRQIDALGGGEGFVRLTNGETVHPALTPWCRELAYSLEPENYAPDGLDVVPLWEGESSITGFFLSGGRPTFIRYYVESLDDYTVIGYDLRAVFGDLIAEYVEDADIDDVLAAINLPT